MHQSECWSLADMKPEEWVDVKKRNQWNNVELRDGRYNQVIHMVSAAKGAEQFYDCVNHVTRIEGIELARHLDDLTAQVCVACWSLSDSLSNNYSILWCFSQGHVWAIEPNLITRANMPVNQSRQYSNSLLHNLDQALIVTYSMPHLTVVYRFYYHFYSPSFLWWQCKNKSSRKWMHEAL